MADLNRLVSIAPASLGGGWSLSQALTAAQITRGHLRFLGVRIPPENRLERAGRLLEEATEYSWPDLPQSEQAHVSEAVRTIMEQYLIVRAVGAASDQLKERLRWLVEGTDLPGASRKTTAHDVQFELVVGAMLVHAGFRDVRLEEPDWRIRIAETEIAVAVKRLSSVKAMVKRVRKAISQIRRYNLPGLILLNLDQLVTRLPPAAAMTRVETVMKQARALVATQRAEDCVEGLFGLSTSFEWLSHPLGDGLGVRPFMHGEVIARDLSEVPRIRATLERLGRNIAASVGRTLNEVPE